MPLRNCLNLAGVAHPDDREVLGREARDRRELDRLVDVERVADPHVGGVDEADDVAGEGLLDRLALLAEHRVGVLGGERLAGAAVGDDHAPLEAARAHPEERDAVAVGRVHVGLHLEHEARERGVERRGACRRRRRAGVGDGRQVDDGVEQQADAEVGQRGAEERRASTRRRGTSLTSRSAPTSSSSVELVGGRASRRRPPRLGGPVGVDELLGRLGGAAGRAGEADEVAVAAVDDAAEVAGDADRPGDRRGRRGRCCCLDLVDAARAGRGPGRSHLLMNVSSGQAALAAHLEQLERLGLDALGRVEHHHRGVGGGQHPVGVLGEVAVARGVEQVDHAVAVGELQHGRGDRDAALLLQLHPVGRGRPATARGP